MDEAIARPLGYTVESTEVAAVRDEQDFLALIETAIARTPGLSLDAGADVLHGVEPD